MIHITGNDRYAKDAKNFGKSLRKLREIGPNLLGVSFKEILLRCEIPEKVYRVYELGLLPPWLPHAHALAMEFDLDLHCLLTGKGPMIYKEEHSTGKISGEAILKRTRRDCGYMLLFKMMKNPNLEAFFLSIMDIIVTDSSTFLDEATLENRALRGAIVEELTRIFAPDTPQVAGQV